MFEFKSHRKEVDERVDTALEAMLEEWGMVAQGFATVYCPVDTGTLRRSITYETDVNSAETVIGTNVEYAVYVETNDKMKHPRGGKAHYMRDAVAAKRSVYEEIASKHLKTVM